MVNVVERITEVCSSGATLKVLSALNASISKIECKEIMEACSALVTSREWDFTMPLVMTMGAFVGYFTIYQPRLGKQLVRELVYREPARLRHWVSTQTGINDGADTPTPRGNN